MSAAIVSRRCGRRSFAIWKRFTAMRMKALGAVLLAGVALAASLSPGFADAHHSFAIFDHTQQVKLTGTVKVFEWTNPHTWIILTVPSKTGGAEESWTITGLSPNLLERHGWKKTTLQPGDKVTVLIYPLRDGKTGGNLISVTLPDGRVMGGGAG